MCRVRAGLSYSSTRGHQPPGLPHRADHQTRSEPGPYSFIAWLNRQILEDLKRIIL